MSLVDIFKRPSVSKILEDRRIIKPEIYPKSKTKTMFLTSLIRKLKDDEVLIIPENYDIIPPGYNALRELHKGDIIKLTRYNSIDDAILENATPELLFIKALSKLEQGKRYLGYEWQGISATARTYRIVPFSELYQAQVIFTNQSEIEQILVKPYTDTKYVKQRGGQVTVSVPSVKKKPTSTYNFRFYHLPLKTKKDNNMNAIWFDVLADHSCPEQTYYPLSYGRILYEDRLRTGDEKIFDAHEISAFKKIKEFFNNRHEKLKIDEDPFFFFSNYGFVLTNILRTRLIKEYLGMENGVSVIKRRLINDKDFSILLADQLFYEKDLLEKRGIRKKIGDYIFKKFFNPRNLNFAVWKDGKFAYE